MIHKLEQVKKDLYKNKRSFSVALRAEKDESKVNKYILGIYNTIQSNNKLLECSMESIKDAAITSACLDVPIDARNLAYLIPYKTKAQFQLSYKGYVYIAKNDPDVDNIQSIIVYDDDEFEIDLGSNIIIHKPNLESQGYGSNDNIRFVYAIVRFKENTGRSEIFEVMTKKQIDAIRSSSKAGGKTDKCGNLTIWEKHYGEMARKTAIKRLCKHAQLGDVARFDQIDNSIEDNKIINVTPDGSLLVEDLNKDDEKTEEIIEAIKEAKDEQELTEVQQKYREVMEELFMYNMGASKKIRREVLSKSTELYMKSVYGYLEGCEDEEGLDKVFEAHEKRITLLKAKERNEVTEFYVEMKQKLIDRKVL